MYKDITTYEKTTPLCGQISNEKYSRVDLWFDSVGFIIREIERSPKGAGVGFLKDIHGRFGLKFSRFLAH